MDFRQCRTAFYDMINILLFKSLKLIFHMSFKQTFNLNANISKTQISIIIIEQVKKGLLNK